MTRINADQKISNFEFQIIHEAFADPRALPDRAEFLRRQIGIAPLHPILLKELGWKGK